MTRSDDRSVVSTIQMRADLCTLLYCFNCIFLFIPFLLQKQSAECIKFQRFFCAPAASFMKVDEFKNKKFEREIESEVSIVYYNTYYIS